MVTRARAKERVEWAKATRRPWRTAAGRHKETHDRRARHHERSSHRFFLDFYRAIAPAIHVTGLCSVRRVVCPSWRTVPGNYQGRGMIAVLHFVRQSWKTWRSLMFCTGYLVWRFWVRLLHCFHRMLSEGMSRLVVGAGELYAAVEWITAAMLLCTTALFTGDHR